MSTGTKRKAVKKEKTRALGSMCRTMNATEDGNRVNTVALGQGCYPVRDEEHLCVECSCSHSRDRGRAKRPPMMDRNYDEGPLSLV
jgi:NifB/MoaA-like Fe-S oxidoreductase